jgi:hypothetical protein
MQYDDGQEIVKGAHNQIGSFRPRLWWPTNLQDSSISGFYHPLCATTVHSVTLLAHKQPKHPPYRTWMRKLTPDPAW